MPHPPARLAKYPAIVLMSQKDAWLYAEGASTRVIETRSERSHPGPGSPLARHLKDAAAPRCIHTWPTLTIRMVNLVRTARSKRGQSRSPVSILAIETAGARYSRPQLVSTAMCSL